MWYHRTHCNRPVGIGYGTPALASMLDCSCLKESCSPLEYKDSGAHGVQPRGILTWLWLRISVSDGYPAEQVQWSSNQWQAPSCLWHKAKANLCCSQVLEIKTLCFPFLNWWWEIKAKCGSPSWYVGREKWGYLFWNLFQYGHLLICPNVLMQISQRHKVKCFRISHFSGL